MKYLWIGPGMGQQTQKEVLARGGKLLSAFVSQTNLVEGLDALSIRMDTINGPKMDESLFPIVPYEKWSRNGQSVDINVGYKNTKYLNRITKEKAICREVDKWLQNQGDEPITVIVYNMHTAFIAAACRIKKKRPNTKIVLIVPDLPQFMDFKMSKLKKLLKDMDWKRIRGYMKYIDKYVLYAAPMADFLDLKAEQWIVMEGSFNPDLVGAETERSDKISIMYSGVLDLRYGIPEMLDAMDLLDDRFELWLTGDGNARSLVEKRAASDRRVKYYGYLPSRQDLLNKQASATMLINPRKDTEEGSKYCFPSKLFEYMVSGRPVISCMLEGMPEEYRAYLVELKSVTAENIAEAVLSVAEMDEEQRKNVGDRAKRYILDAKNKYSQAEKMWEFINS